MLVSQTARLSYIVSERMAACERTHRYVSVGVWVWLYISVLFGLNLFRQHVHWIVALWVRMFPHVLPHSLGSKRISYVPCPCPWRCWLLNRSGLPFWISHKYLLLGFFFQLLYQSHKFRYVSVRIRFAARIWWLFFLLVCFFVRVVLL